MRLFQFHRCEIDFFFLPQNVSSWTFNSHITISGRKTKMGMEVEMEIVMHSEHVRHRNVVLCALDLSCHASLLLQPFVFSSFFSSPFVCLPLFQLLSWACPRPPMVKYGIELYKTSERLKIPSMCWSCAEGLGCIWWAKTLTCINESTCQSFYKPFQWLFHTNEKPFYWYTIQLQSSSLHI